MAASGAGVTAGPVLVIDDDPAMLRTVGEALEPEGYEVLMAPSGPAGLEITRRRPPALILLDIGMPEMDGFAFLAAYRAAEPAHAPVVVLTGRLDDARWRDDTEILDRVTKPFDVADLLHVVDKHAGSSAEADVEQRANALLAEIAGQRNPDSLQAVYELYAAEGLGVCLHILRDRMSAEDVLQEAFLQVWHKACTFDPGRGSARKWILSVIYHQAIDRVRRQRRSPVSPPTWPLDWSPGSHDVWDEVERRLREEQLCEALQALPADQRMAVEMAYFGGFTHAEIADLLHVPLGTVKGRLRLAMEKLRMRLHGLSDPVSP